VGGKKKKNGTVWDRRMELISEPNAVETRITMERRSVQGGCWSGMWKFSPTNTCGEKKGESKGRVNQQRGGTYPTYETTVGRGHHEIEEGAIQVEARQAK